MKEKPAEQIIEYFKNPPNGYGMVPFYWWLGDRVTKEKLLYHLEQLAHHHISGLQINYAHSDEGGQSFGLTYPGDPALFSEEWWELLGWFMKEAKKRQIAVSLSDYTLGSPGQGYYGDWILRKYPQMQGCHLSSFRKVVEKGDWFWIEEAGIRHNGVLEPLPTSRQLLNAVICKGEDAFLIERTDKKHQVKETGELILVYAKQKEYSIDPMYPGVGEKYIENFFGKFEEHFPGECGTGLNFFFSDELNFNISGNLWNVFFAEEFIKRKGYDLCPFLYLIFKDAGEKSVKIRLDYYDVIVQLEEEHYFSKIYQWHEERNMTYGCDHGGRGKDITEFGDYMRTQKYNQGVGCDQPMLQSDIIKNKVAASIAHLYGRERVWLEGFYGSGWGTSTEQLTDAIARNFVMGHNLLSLHGFYYSTHGSFWEWAPPCNCVRAPYWNNMQQLTGAVERLSYLMSRGVHCCKIGIVYPVAAMESGKSGKAAVDTAFALGEALYESGIDFDFLDFESILRAQIEAEHLVVCGECFHLIVLPDMNAVRCCMYDRLAEAANKGVVVMAIARWPSWGDGDVETAGAVLKKKGVCKDSVKSALSYISEKIERDVIPSVTGKFYINHRKLLGLDLYMTYGIGEGERCFFRGKGNAYLLNPWNGSVVKLRVQERNGEGMWINMPVQSSEFQVVALGDIPGVACEKEEGEWVLVQSLDGEWDFCLLPTLDNTWGDFELPASPGILPCMVKELHKGEQTFKVGYGPFFTYKENFYSKEAFFEELEKAAKGDDKEYKEYHFSLRYGVENDPGHQGYHGLKGNITDDFMQIGVPKQTQTDVCFKPYEGGSGKIFVMRIFCKEEQMAQILTGDLKPEAIYINGSNVTGSRWVLLKKGVNLVAAGYLEIGRTHLVFVQKEYREEAVPLSMRWYKMHGMLPFVMKKEAAPYWFLAPPALEELTFFVHAKIEKVLLGGVEAAFKQEGTAVKVVFENYVETVAKTELFLQPEPGYLDGAVFDGPLLLKCGTGKLKTGDWSQVDGLKYYSGGASYSKKIMWEGNKGRRIWLLMERVVASAEVFINGQLAGVKVAPPWKVEIGDFLQKGINRIEIRVYNTLGNQYEYVPTRYKSGIESGLIGKVALWASSEKG